MHFLQEEEVGSQSRCWARVGVREREEQQLHLGQLEGGSLHPWCVPGLVSQDRTEKMSITGLESPPTVGSRIFPGDIYTTVATCSRGGQGQVGVDQGHSGQRSGFHGCALVA